MIFNFLLVCGGKISGSTGDIMSYRFGETNYTEQVHCGWNIEVSNNMTLAFVFDVFETYAPANVIDNPDNQCYNYNYFSYGHYDSKLFCLLLFAY